MTVQGMGAGCTFLVADVVASTRLYASLGPAGWDRFTSMYGESFDQLIGSEGGALTEMSGDGVIAAFRSDGEAAGHASRAVRCGLSLCRAMERLAEDLKIEPKTDGAVRVAACSSEGLAGEASAYNVVSRLVGIAPPNGVLISEVTAAMLDPGEFVLADQGKVPVKGVDAPLRVFLVVSPVRPSPAVDDIEALIEAFYWAWQGAASELILSLDERRQADAGVTMAMEMATTRDAPREVLRSFFHWLGTKLDASATAAAVAAGTVIGTAAGGAAIAEGSGHGAELSRLMKRILHVLG